MAMPVVIDVYSDVVCPWCYLGKRRLAAAVAARPAVPVGIRWHPYQLDPTIPPGGVPRAAYVARKFGSADAVRPAHARLEAFGAEVGIDFRFDAIAVSPNTLDAHRLIRWSTAAGDPEPMVEALFRGYFTEALDIGDREVLADLAAGVGFAREEIRARLESEEDRAAVGQEAEEARAAGIEGVPFFIFNARLAASGAQPSELLAQGIDQAQGLG